MKKDFDAALRGTTAPKEIVDTLALVSLQYVDFAGKEHHGHLVIAKDLVAEVTEIFHELFMAEFPIATMTPIAEYEWDDDASMRANNCSGFNYRVIAGTDRLSLHAAGRAIDINPLQNPYIVHGLSSPPGLVYDPRNKGALVAGSAIVQAFTSRGWEWGGNWNPLGKDGTIDYQHFQKPAKA